MKATKEQLTEIIQENLKKVLLEEYIRKELLATLNEDAASMSSTKIETLLKQILAAIEDGLEDIDVSVDTLTALSVGGSAAGVQMGQVAVGRGLATADPSKKTKE